MKVELENVRCHRGKKTFTFPESGLILLSGPSGSGKTSILKSIHFALYGKEQRIMSSGEKRFKVTLSYKDWKIERGKSTGNYLRVEYKDIHGQVQQLDGESAQSKINQQFGQHFMLTNYLTQKGMDTFLNAKKEERKQFLQDLIAQTFDIEGCRNMVKNQVRERKLNLTAKSAALQALRQEMKLEGIVAVEEPSFPLGGAKMLGCVTIEQRLEMETFYRQKQKRKQEILRQQIMVIESQEKDYLQKQLERNTLRLRLEHLNSQEEMWGKKLSLLNGETLNVNELKECSTNLQLYIQKHEWSGQLEQVEKQYNELVVQVQKDAENASKRIKEELDKLEDVSSSLDAESFRKQTEQMQKCMDVVKDIVAAFPSRSTTTCVKGIYQFLNQEVKTVTEKIVGLRKDVVEMEERVKTANTELERLKQNKKRIQDDLSGHVLKCPSCASHLVYKNSCLITRNVDQLNKDLQALEPEIEAQTYSVQESEYAKDVLQNDVSRSMTKLDRITNLISKLKPFVSVVEKVITLQDIESRQKQYKTLVEKITKRDKLKQDYASASSRERTIKDVDPGCVAKKREVARVKQILDSVKMKLKVELKYTYEEAQKELERVKNQIVLSTKVQQDIDEIQVNLVSLEQEREEVMNKLNKLEVKSIEQKQSGENDLGELRCKLNQIESSLQRYEIRHEKVVKWEREMEVYERYQRYTGRLKQMEQEENVAQRSLSTALLFLKKMDEEESVLLQSTVQSINLLLDDYMEAFFEEETKMELITVKEVETNTSSNAKGDQKPVLDVKITRGGETIPLDSLSGGEYDRALLALFLCFNRYSNNEFLMLDECLSSIHAEAVEQIVDFIKTKNPDKLVLMTLHQANVGFFDAVVPMCCS
jgi:exonuclease SbcC